MLRQQRLILTAAFTFFGDNLISVAFTTKRDRHLELDVTMPTLNQPKIVDAYIPNKDP